MAQSGHLHFPSGLSDGEGSCGSDACSMSLACKIVVSRLTDDGSCQRESGGGLRRSPAFFESVAIWTIGLENDAA